MLYNTYNVQYVEPWASSPRVARLRNGGGAAPARLGIRTAKALLEIEGPQCKIVAILI